MTALQPYPAYKDSGVEWLGEVPEHWQVRRLGSLGRFSASGIDKNTVPGESLVSMVNYMDIYDNPTRELDASRTYQEVSCPEWKRRIHDLARGDLLFTPSSETSEEIGFSAVCAEDLVDTVYSYHVMRFRTATRMDIRFKKYWCNCRPVLEQFSARCKGTTRQILTSGDFRSIWTVVPTPGEQHAIARFLDHADRRIRRYIRAKERLIELLDEEKRGVIHQAVTGRIDVRTGQPYPAYKDSGVEWLGEVPEHWEVRRLKTLSVMQSGDAITAMSIDKSGDYPVYGGNGVRGYTSSYTHDGDFVLMGRQGALCGNIHLAHGRFWASEHAVVATLRRGHILDWFGALLRVMDLNQYSIAAAQPGLSVDRVMNLWAPVPPIREQMRISERLAERSGHLLGAVEATKRQIALLREYRNRLIADVVTGKLDVRDAAAELPSQDDLVGGHSGTATEGRPDVTNADAEPV